MSPSALTPGFWLHMCQAAANQVVSGKRVSAKIVPAVIELSARQLAQRRFRPLLMRQPLVAPQTEQPKPPGQRSRAR